MARYSVFGELKPAPPFDFKHSIRFIEGFEPTQDEQKLGVGILTKATSIHEKAVVFELRSTGTIDSPCLSYNLYSEQPFSDEIEQATLESIGRFLSLDDDLSGFYARGREDSIFRGVIQQLYGYHQVRFPSAFESACWAILSQRTPYAGAIAQKKELMKCCGPAMRFHGMLHQAFPEPGVIASQDLAALTALAGSERRSRYLQSAAHAFASIDSSFLYSAPVHEVSDWLLSIAGIGPWSAAFILIRGLGRMESLPVEEKRLKAEILRRYGEGRSLADDEIEQIADRYGPWKGYWAHYLRAASLD